ncbi:MAG: hypothetical protein KF881_09360 [Acidobacteria bacterium]|nr:hypothetical protein [Acidobacteriota bacterium]
MEKYKATIRGDNIEWDGEAPDAVKDGKLVRVEVTLVSKPVKQSKRNAVRAVAALKEIASRGGISSIPDPVAWQREIRKDRPLPGRD